MTGNVHRPVVYLEPTFISRLTGDETADAKVRGEQEATRTWWNLMKDKVQAVVSYLVLQEISDGNPAKAARRVAAVRGLPSWGPSPEAEELADRLIDAHAIPATEEDDAHHVALAAVGGADLLLTWNTHHIKNPVTLPKTVKIVMQAGYDCPAIVSPDELLDLMEDEP